MGDSMTNGAQTSEFRLGWRVLLAGLFGVAFGASPIPFNTIGLTLAPINAEMGWSFAQISAGVLVFGVVASLLLGIVAEGMVRKAEVPTLVVPAASA
jgi:uncharacterized protein (DUF697 family)